MLDQVHFCCRSLCWKMTKYDVDILWLTVLVYELFERPSYYRCSLTNDFLLSLNFMLHEWRRLSLHGSKSQDRDSRLPRPRQRLVKNGSWDVSRPRLKSRELQVWQQRYHITCIPALLLDTTPSHQCQIHQQAATRSTVRLNGMEIWKNKIIFHRKQNSMSWLSIIFQQICENLMFSNCNFCWRDGIKAATPVLSGVQWKTKQEAPLPHRDAICQLKYCQLLRICTIQKSADFNLPHLHSESRWGFFIRVSLRSLTLEN